MKQLFASLLLAASLSAPVYAQLKLPNAAPAAKITQDFSLSSIEINYTRPSIHGQRIFGDIVPFGQAWETGEGMVAHIRIGEELDFAGIRVKAGEYALYTIPNKDKWTVVLNMGTSSWGINGYAKEDDIARITVKPDITPGVYQTFTMNITDITYTSCKLEMLWERTRITVPIVARNETKIATDIDRSIPASQFPYYKVATYYFESNQKSELARNYVNKAAEADPKAYDVWFLKARIEKKLGNYDEAVMSAKKSIELAEGNPDEYRYKHENQKIIDEIYRKSRPKQIDE
ncbi:MAG: DUF2911 domain-containing protein [Bacteroidota bacterium]